MRDIGGQGELHHVQRRQLRGAQGLHGHPEAECGTPDPTRQAAHVEGVQGVPRPRRHLRLRQRHAEPGERAAEEPVRRLAALRGRRAGLQPRLPAERAGREAVGALDERRLEPVRDVRREADGHQPRQPGGDLAVRPGRVQAVQRRQRAVPKGLHVRLQTAVRPEGQHLLQVCQRGAGRPDQPVQDQHERQGQGLRTRPGHGGRREGADGAQSPDHVAPLRGQ